MNRPPIALTIAGSDSGGGAGIQADLKTFHQLGVHGTSVLTAITAQNTRSVTGIEPVSPSLVAAQMAALAADLPADAVKSGMLFGDSIIDAVADGLDAFGGVPYVLDPVMVASSGDPLIDEGARDALTTKLLPRATLVTPNLYEASLMTGLDVADEDTMLRAAAKLRGLGAGAVLLKGGHLDARDAVDVLVWQGGTRTWRRPKLLTMHTHGTGCTLSAAVAAFLARGRELDAAVDEALAFLARAIETAPGLGGGRGPLNHFVGS